MSLPLAALALLGLPLTGRAATISLTPVYSSSYSDAVTGDNCAGMTVAGGCQSNGWDVDPLADVYGLDLYERPTKQTFTLSGGEYVATEYLGYLDLVSAQYGYTGFDTTSTTDDYMFFQLNVFSPHLYKNDGTVDTGVFGSGTYYGVQLGSTNGDDGQLLLRAEQTKDTVDTSVGSPFPLFDSTKTQGWYDTNNSVSGPGGVATPNEEGVISNFNGYESGAIQTDGNLAGTSSTALYSRSFYNANGTVSIELALNYNRYNVFCQTSALCDPINPTTLPYLVFEATQGLKDNQSYLWNDKYNATEAGSPYGGSSLGNIYELDNLRSAYTGTTPVPEPASLFLLGSGVAAVLARQRLKKRG